MVDTKYGYQNSHSAPMADITDQSMIDRVTGSSTWGSRQPEQSIGTGTILFAFPSPGWSHTSVQKVEASIKGHC